MEYENDQRGYDGLFPSPRGSPAVTNQRTDEPRSYRRDNENPRARSASPTRSASPNGRDSRYVSNCSC